MTNPSSPYGDPQRDEPAPAEPATNLWSAAQPPEPAFPPPPQFPAPPAFPPPPPMPEPPTSDVTPPAAPSYEPPPAPSYTPPAAPSYEAPTAPAYQYEPPAPPAYQPPQPPAYEPPPTAPGYPPAQPPAPMPPAVAYPPTGYAVPNAAGYGFDPATGQPLSDKSKVVAGLLQIGLAVMIGVGGVGRLYAGNTQMGAIQLGASALGWVSLCCGIVGNIFVLFLPILVYVGVVIWFVVDGIMMLTGRPVDGQGRLLRS